MAGQGRKIIKAADGYQFYVWYDTDMNHATLSGKSNSVPELSYASLVLGLFAVLYLSLGPRRVARFNCPAATPEWVAVPQGIFLRALLVLNCRFLFHWSGLCNVRFDSICFCWLVWHRVELSAQLNTHWIKINCIVQFGWIGRLLLSLHLHWP